MFNFLSQAFIPSTSNSSGSFATLNPLQMTGNQLGFLNGQTQAYNYQQELNDKMMSREDNAYQRAVADAKAAGLSPLSVSGGASANSMQSASFNNSGVLSFGAQLAQLKVEADIQKEKNAIAKQDADTRSKLVDAQSRNLDSGTVLNERKADYQDIVNEWLPKEKQLNLDNVSAEIGFLKTRSWSLERGDARAERDLASLIGVRESEIRNQDAKTKELLETLVYKIANLKADSALKVANELLAYSKRDLVDIEKATAEEKFGWLAALMQKSLDVSDAQIKNLDYENASIVLKSVLGVLAGAVSVGSVL